MSCTVYGTAASGNCHKVRMALDILGEPYEWREIDVLKGESRTPEFLAMNPNGKVPVLAIDGATFLPESNAILWYLGEGTKLVPDDRLARARVLQWMFFEQYSHEPAIAVARFIRRFLKRDVQGELFSRALKPANWGTLGGSATASVSNASSLTDSPDLVFNGLPSAPLIVPWLTCSKSAWGGRKPALRATRNNCWKCRD